MITDLLGLTYGFIPRHAKQYEHLADRMTEAITAYATEVAAGTFPTAENSSSMDAAVLAEVLGAGELDRAALARAATMLRRADPPRPRPLAPFSSVTRDKVGRRPVRRSGGRCIAIGFAVMFSGSAATCMDGPSGVDRVRIAADVMPAVHGATRRNLPGLDS